jgi:hypothetical protein
MNTPKYVYKMQKYYKTPDLEKALGLTRMTFYLWEEKGIFTPPRNMRGDRVFTKKQLNEIVRAFSPGGSFKWHFESEPTPET